MEKLIAEYFGKMLLEPMTDQWGNIQASPVNKALSKYIEDNQEKIFGEVIKRLSVEKIANSMADRLLDISKGIYGSQYSREKIIEDLKGKIAEIMAEKISKDLKI